MCQPPQPEADRPTELAKLQFDYAWKWFSYHADQRHKMFYYLLIVIGLFATAIATAYDKHLSNLFLAALCFGAAFLALVFSRLDFRNQQLVWLGEDILIHLEQTIFRDPKEIKGRILFLNQNNKKIGDEADVTFGILKRQQQEDRPATNCKCLQWIRNLWSGKHRYLLRGIAYIVAALFALVGVLLLIQPIGSAAWGIGSTIMSLVFAQLT